MGTGCAHGVFTSGHGHQSTHAQHACSALFVPEGPGFGFACFQLSP